LLLPFNIIKGMVHPKMKIMPLITQPHVVPNSEVFGKQVKIFLMESESFFFSP